MSHCHTLRMFDKRLPDRKDLLAYLNGEITTSENIDESTPVEGIPTQVECVTDGSTESVANEPHLDIMDVQTETEVDTVGTHQGMSVTGGDQPNMTPVFEIRHPQPVLAAVSIWSSGYNKQISRTPIIVLPPGTCSLITIYNAKDILEDLNMWFSSQV
ncbi:accessory factor associated with RNA polymerase II [Homalodisca vitripennis]|nr:accessory factor associated with RNA polymerase II [Homalodisca vitripennis]